MWSADLPAKHLAGEHVQGWWLPGWLDPLRYSGIGHSQRRRRPAGAVRSRFDTGAAARGLDDLLVSSVSVSSLQKRILTWPSLQP
jgi:hypothetical protein